MGLNSLKIASGGYLKRTSKTALIIAVSGYLNYSDTPISLSPSGRYYASEKVYKNDYQRRMLMEDSNIVEIVKICLKIATI